MIYACTLVGPTPSFIPLPHLLHSITHAFSFSFDCLCLIVLHYLILYLLSFMHPPYSHIPLLSHSLSVPTHCIVYDML